ncbi:MAG: hypothetical protein AAF411_25565 [Myxococcota bacterium]
MKQSPLAAAKARFDITEQDPTKARKAAKEKLIAAVKGLVDSDGLWIDRVNESKGLETVSNKKLLHLHDVLSAVKEFGGRDAVIKAIVEAEGRSKDAHFAKHFEDFPTPKLWDHYRAAKKRS